MPTADTDAPDTTAQQPATEQVEQDELIEQDDAQAATAAQSASESDADSVVGPDAESGSEPDAESAITDESSLQEPGIIVAGEEQQTGAEELAEALPEPLPEPPPPKPIQLVLWNDKVPASAGCWVFWREAGFECRGKIEKGLFTATCKGLGGSTASVPTDILLRRRFISQGEAIAVMAAMLSFDPQQAESFGFEITGRAMLPFLPVSPVSPVSGALDEEQAAVSG